MKHCPRDTYFIYKNQHYHQIKTAPMGFSLTLRVFDLFMQDIEQKSPQSSPQN